MAPGIILWSFPNSVASTNLEVNSDWIKVGQPDHLVMNSCCQGDTCAAECDPDGRSRLPSLGCFSLHAASTGCPMQGHIF